MTLIDNPEHLRMRAAEMRGRADKAVYPETRQGLLRIAEDYDLLATRAERRLVLLAEAAEGHGPRVNADTAVDRNPNNSQPEPSDETQI